MDAPVMLVARSAQAAREVRRNSPLRQARTCYDHLAGIAGVELMDGLLSLGWLVEEKGPRLLYQLTDQGECALLSLGVDVPGAVAQSRPFAYACLDWTERRHHLRGSLAGAILKAMCDSGMVLREQGTRSVAVDGLPSAWLGTSF